MNNEIILIAKATWDTLVMTFISGGFSFLLGVPLGVLLFLTSPGQLLKQRFLHKILSFIVNIGRSVPFIILMVAIIPFTRFLTGSSIGTIASLVPLTISAIPFVARITEGAIAEVPTGLIETGYAMGATPVQIITKILLPEALPALIHGGTLTLITLVGYTSMAGAIGGGGLGAVAINYGYQRFNGQIILMTVAILIIIVQFLQLAGENLKARYSHR